MLAAFYGAGLLTVTVLGVYTTNEKLVDKIWSQVETLQGALLGIITDKTYQVWTRRKDDAEVKAVIVANESVSVRAEKDKDRNGNKNT